MIRGIRIVCEEKTVKNLSSILGKHYHPPCQDPYYKVYTPVSRTEFSKINQHSANQEY